MNRLKSIKMKAGQKSSDTRLPKPPKPPEKPLMPYMRYSRKVWESVKNANPLLKLWEVGKIIGQMWRELPENEKSHFIEEYENDKIQYNDALRMYNNSPAYKSWLLHKEKMEKSLEDNDSLDGMSQSQFFKQKDRISKDPHNVETRESYILEDNDEDPDEVFTLKHVAAQRFQRNHKFMLDLFSDFKVPELGAIVTESRMNSLKQQVNGLLMHKRKLDEEIEDWDKKHNCKKMKIKVESEDFWQGYNKELEARPVITENMFSEMVKRARDDIFREEKERDEFIRSRLYAAERKTSSSDHSTESNFKSESNSSGEQSSLPPSHFEPAINQNNDVSVPNPFTASVVNKPHAAESQGLTGPPTALGLPEPHQNMLASSFMQMPQRSHPNPFENRSLNTNYAYAQQPTPPNSMPNYPNWYPPSMAPNNPQIPPQLGSPQPLSQQSVQMTQRASMMCPADTVVGDPDQKSSKLKRGNDVQSQNTEKDAHAESRNTISKDKSESPFPTSKLSDTQACPPNLPLNIKAPTMSPKIEAEVKTHFHDSVVEASPSSQSPSKKASSKKRRPPANKTKTSSHAPLSEMDALSSGQMTPESGSSSSMANPSHISPVPKMEATYAGDPSLSQMPLQQGIYPYHCYPPQFVPHGRTPAQYGLPYQQGFNQPSYYGQMPQQYRQMAPHQMPGEAPASQFAMQHKPVPPNQPYPSNPYGPAVYGAYGPQYPSGQPFPHSGAQSMQEAPQPQAVTNKETPVSQPAPMATHMGAPDDSAKYQSEVAVSSAPSAAFNSAQLGSMAPAGYPAQYPGLPYTNPPSTGAYYSGVQGHYFYYPPGPQAHGAPTQTPPEQAFWTHPQASSYPSSSSLANSAESAADSQAPKVQD